MHWQIGKGGGFHYHEAEERDESLPVTVFLGGPPALIISAIAPLPEDVPELMLASLLAKLPRTVAVLLVSWRHWVPSLLAAGFGASTLGAFVIATSVGLFGVHEHWVGAYVWIAAVAEVVALGGGLVLLLREAPALRTRAVQSQHRLSLGRLHLH